MNEAKYQVGDLVSFKEYNFWLHGSYILESKGIIVAIDASYVGSLYMKGKLCIHWISNAEKFIIYDSGFNEVTIGSGTESQLKIISKRKALEK